MMDDGYESGSSCRIAQAEPATKREGKEEKNCDSRRRQTVQVPYILYSVDVWPVFSHFSMPSPYLTCCYYCRF